MLANAWTVSNGTKKFLNSPFFVGLSLIDLQTMQVTGKFSAVIDKVKIAGPLALWNGSLAAASATFVGHYP